MVEKRKQMSAPRKELGVVLPGYPHGSLSGLMFSVDVPVLLQRKVLVGLGLSFAAGFLLAKLT